MEANIQVMEGAQYRLRVKLTNEAGEQLPPENFRVYGGAFCPGYAPAHFHAERTAEEWVLTMPGLKPGRVPWNWQVIAAEYATGVEWLLASGEVTVTPRHATGSAAVDPGELNVLATLDKTTLKMTVQLGESTAACSLAVVAARNSAAAAAGSAEAAREHSVGAEAAQRAAEDAAADAAADAVTAQHQAGAAAASAAAAAGSAAQAAASAAGANADAELAGEHVTEAAARATAAAASATDAATSSKAAADSASEAIEAAESATRQAASAADSATAAAGSETAAEGSATAAADSETAAADSATAAADSATAAAGSATAAAASAAKLGDAALKGANNSFSGTNTFNGQLVANSGLSVQGVPLADVIVGECDHVRHMACASFGDTPMEFLPSTYAEWAAENAAALSGDKNTLSVLLSAAEADARTLPTGYKKIMYFNMGKMGALKIAEATNAVYIYERATNVQAWNMAGISAKVVTLVYPELTKIKDAFYNIKAQRVNLVFPKLSAVTTYGFEHLTQGVTEARFYMPQLSRGMSMFSQCALSAASLLSLAKTLPAVASAQVITIGAAAALESDTAFQTALAAALAGKNWTFTIKYN